MSHFKERKEKNCLNCNTEVQGKYCHVCGQENIEPKETAWHLVTHFFNDITHFDGKFFSTLKLLIIRPGFLSQEYMIGRRNSYLNPIRMYIFTSAIFFLIFFSFLKMDKGTSEMQTTVNGKTTEQIAAMDSTTFSKFTKEVNKEEIDKDLPMTRGEFAHYLDSVRSRRGLQFTSGDYPTKGSYDSVLASGKKHHNWMQRQLIYKQIEVNTKFKNNTEEIFHAFIETLLHSLPQMIFISLPLFALLLRILYSRRKQFYYVNHAIFSVHLYIFIFIVMLVLFCISKLNSNLHWAVFKWLSFLVYLLLFFYEYKALRNFYKQGRGKTIFKFILLNIGFLFLLLILFTIFIFFSFFKI